MGISTLKRYHRQFKIAELNEKELELELQDAKKDPLVVEVELKNPPKPYSKVVNKIGK